MANHLSLEKKTLVVKLLCEGNSIRATARIADVAFNTVLKLVPQLGYACIQFHNEHVKGLLSQRVQADEIWSYVGCKQKNVPDGEEDMGDCWTWTAIDADSKLIISWLVGDRSFQSAKLLLTDLKYRVRTKFQLSTDSLKAYKRAVREVFAGDIHYGQIHKVYQSSQEETRYSPAVCVDIQVKIIAGKPIYSHISTSYVERQNLTMRMHMRRFTRLTNAFSKKVENHAYAVALYFVYYNWVKIHKTLRVTPAVEAGLTKDLMEFEDIVALMDKYLMPLKKK